MNTRAYARYQRAQARHAALALTCEMWIGRLPAALLARRALAFGEVLRAIEDARWAAIGAAYGEG